MPISAYTAITLLSVVEIFLDSTDCPKISYSNIIHDWKIFPIEILLFGRWPMVIPSLITATAYMTLALVGSLEHVNSSPTVAGQLSLYKVAAHTAKYLYFSSLGGSVPSSRSLLVSGPAFF